MRSLHTIGQTEVGLVTKNFGFKSLSDGSPIAFNGEPGYQADLLMAGTRFMLWPVFSVQKHPWVQVPAGEIGVVISQVGDPMPIGAKSAVFKPEFGNFTNLHTFVEKGGQKGLQRPVLPPGSLIALHPVAFLVITKQQIFGLPVDETILGKVGKQGRMTCQAFGLEESQLELVRIEADTEAGTNSEVGKNSVKDMIGIVTVNEGAPLEGGDIASRIGGFTDIMKIEAEGDELMSKIVSTGTSEDELKVTKQQLQLQVNATNAKLAEAVLGTNNHKHNNYQDFQMFIDAGGKIGLQHDPLLYGSYALNPFLVSVQMVPMLVVNQGEVAVIKGYVGLATQDTSGAEFKFGSIVRPGHRGVWEEPLRTGKYAINPRCYEAVKVPTAILTLNWAEANSIAHNLDKNLKAIAAKSKEGFGFDIDLQVQIHVPDTEAPKVISMVGNMPNLVNEVLQAAVGNHFRNKLQSMAAVDFIEKRQEIQEAAYAHVSSELRQYRIETRGVYIQDVILPPELVIVLKEREIANQQIATNNMRKSAEDARVKAENSKGIADAQADLAKSEVGKTIATNEAEKRKAQGQGESDYTGLVGKGEAAKIEAIGKATATAAEALGKANAEAYRLQKDAVGESLTAMIKIAEVISAGKIKLVPEFLVVGGGGNSATMDGALATLMQFLQKASAGKGDVSVPLAGAEKSDASTTGTPAT